LADFRFGAHRGVKSGVARGLIRAQEPTFIVLGTGAEAKPPHVGPFRANRAVDAGKEAAKPGRPPGQLLRHAFNREGAAERCVFFTDLPDLRKILAVAPCPDLLQAIPDLNAHTLWSVTVKRRQPAG
jgi:hypothetical protein